MILNNYYINGPVSCFRLEDNNEQYNKKIIYIFSDIHYDVNIQTKCNNIESIDIDKYLYKIFKKIRKNDKMYDFFVETNFEYMKNDINNTNKRKYIDEISSFLLMNINMII